MTPVEQAGWKVGDLGTVVKHSGTFAVGSVVKLKWDDRTDCPLWGLITGQCYYKDDEAFMSLERVTPLPPIYARTEESAYVIEDCQVNKEEKEPSPDDIWEQIKRSCN